MEIRSGSTGIASEKVTPHDTASSASNCAIGDNVWSLAPRGDYIAVFSRYGETVELASPRASTDGDCMLSLAYVQPSDSVWLGYSSGVIRILSGIRGRSHNRKLTDELVVHERGVTELTTIAVFGQDTTVVSISLDGRVAMWDAVSLVCRGCVKLSDNGLRCLVPALFSNYCGVIVGTTGGALHSASIQSPDDRLVAAAHAGEVRGLAMRAFSSNDEGEIWSGGADGNVLCWRVRCVRRSILLDRQAQFRFVPVSGMHDLLHVSLLSAKVLGVLYRHHGVVTLDSVTGAVMHHFREGDISEVRNAFVVPCGFRQIMVCSSDHVVGCVNIPLESRSADTHVMHGTRSAIPPAPLEHDGRQELREDVQKLRSENQKLREQIQTLLKSPLQRSIAAATTANAVPHDSSRVASLMAELRTAQQERDAAIAEKGAAETRYLDSLKHCYATAVKTLESTEVGARDQLKALEDDVKKHSSIWFSYAHRSAVVSNEVHDLRNNVDGLVKELRKKSDLLDASEREAASQSNRCSVLLQRLDTVEYECNSLRQRHCQCEPDMNALRAAIAQRDDRLAAALHSVANAEAASKIATERCDAQQRSSEEAIATLQNEKGMLIRERDDLLERLTSQMRIADEYRTRASQAAASEENTLRRVQQLERHLAERESMTQELMNKEDTHTRTKEKNAQLVEKLEQLESLACVLRKENALQSQELQVLSEKSRKKQLAVSESSEAHVQALHEEIAELRSAVAKELMEKAHIVADKERLANELKSQSTAVRKEIAAMDAEMSSLQHQQEQIKAAEIAVLESRIRFLNDQNEDILRELETMKSTHKHQREDYESRVLNVTESLRLCEAQLSDVRSENERLQLKLDSSEKFAREYEAMVMQESARRHSTEVMSIKHKEDVEQTLRHDLEVSKESRLALETQLIEANLTIAKIEAEMQLRQSALELQLQTAQRKMDEMTQASMIAQREHESEVARLLQTKEAIQQRATENSAAHQAELRRVTEESQKEIALLTEKLKNKTAEWLSCEVALEERCQQLQKQLRQEALNRDDALGSLDAQLRKSQREAKQFAAENVQLLRSLEQARQAAFEAASQESTVLQRQLEGVTETCHHLEKQLSESHQHQQDIQEQFKKDLAAQTSKFTAELEVLTKRASQFEADAIAAKEELERALKMCRKLSNDNTLQCTESEDLRTQLARTNERMRDAHKEAEDMKTKLNSLESAHLEREELVGKASRCEKECVKLRVNLSVQEQLVFQLQEEIKALRDDLRDAQAKSITKDEELSKHRSTLAELMATAAQQQQQVQALQEENRLAVVNLRALELEQRNARRDLRSASPTFTPNRSVLTNSRGAFSMAVSTSSTAQAGMPSPFQRLWQTSDGNMRTGHQPTNLQDFMPSTQLGSRR